jgi:hypothetical protein
MPPTRRRAFSIWPISAWSPARTPAVTSVCPFRYLVALCALHDQVDAERERLLVDRAREGVVDD